MVWTTGSTSGRLPPDHTYFIVYAPRANKGNIVESFHNAKNIEDAKKTLSKARETLAREGGWNISDAAKEHVEVVFNADAYLVASVITRLTVDTIEDSPENTLKSLLLEKLVGEDSFDLVIRWAHGWVKQSIDRFLEHGQPPRIVKKDFHVPLVNFVRTHDRISILQSVAGAPSEKEIEAEIAVRNYVKQLRVIDLDDVDVFEAVNDFLSASVDRTTWSDLGMISKDSLDTLEKELKITWRNKQRRTHLGFDNKKEKEQGQIIYMDCMEHDARVDGLETPRQFIRGSWHALADDLVIGWHPQYITMLSEMASMINDLVTKGK